MRVILIDDCLHLRTAIAALLAIDQRIEVVGEAADGVQGLRLVQELRPDVVVTDLEMPVMDGVEYIKKQLQRGYLPIIVFSAVDTDSPMAQRARESGAFGHIAKPKGAAEVSARHQLLLRQILAAYFG